MSYYETVGGMGKRGFSEGMGADFPIVTTPNEELRRIQQDLQRMSLLAPGTGATGADGRWGLRTGGALQQAKTRLGRTAAPFVIARGGRSVSIPDDFIAAIHTAATPVAEGGPVSLPSGPDASMTPPSALPSIPLPPTVEETTPPSHVRLYVIGGSVLAVAGIAAFMFWPKSTTPNRRRARRNRRR